MSQQLEYLNQDNAFISPILWNVKDGNWMVNKLKLCYFYLMRITGLYSHKNAEQSQRNHKTTGTGKGSHQEDCDCWRTADRSD